jgi:cell division septation protein DedD
LQTLSNHLFSTTNQPKNIMKSIIKSSPSPDLAPLAASSILIDWPVCKPSVANALNNKLKPQILINIAIAILGAFFCVFSVQTQAQTVVYESITADPLGDVYRSTDPDIVEIKIQATSDNFVNLSVTFAPGTSLGDKSAIFYFSRDQLRTPGTYNNYGIGADRADIRIYAQDFQGVAASNSLRVTYPVVYSGTTMSTRIPLSVIVGSDDGAIDLRVISVTQFSNGSNSGIEDDCPNFVYTTDKLLPIVLQLPMPPPTPTPTPTVSPTPSPTPTPGPSPTPTPTVSPTPSPTPTPDPNPTPTPNPIPTPEPNTTPTPNTTSGIDYAPATVPVGSVIQYEGIANSTAYTNPISENIHLLILSEVDFENGTYTYTKTGVNTATVDYTSYIFEEDEETGETYSDSQEGALLITFNSESGGSYTSSGSETEDFDGDVISGTFTGAGTFSYTQPLVMVVPAKLKAAKVGKKYLLQLKSTGGLSNTWSLAKGKLPTGLKLSKRGLISGKPSKAATYKIALKITSAVGQTSKKTVSLVVKK